MEFTNAGPHKSEWTSSKGEEAINWDLWKGRLCILPYRQCVQEWSIELQLLITDLILGKRIFSTRSWGWPSLICQRDLLKAVSLATLLQTFDDKESCDALWG